MYQTVSSHTTPIEAHIIRCRLEHEGIPAIIAFEHHIWADWSLSVALGGVRIQVPSIYVVQALSVIENIRLGKYINELEEDQKPYITTCVKCGSSNIHPMDWSWKISLLILFLYSLPIPYSSHLIRCRTCSHIWTNKQERGYPLYIVASIIFILLGIILLGYIIWCYYRCGIYCINILCI